MTCRFDQTLRRPSVPMTLCRIASSQVKEGGMTTGPTSTSHENGAGIDYVASTLNISTCQIGTRVQETAIHTQSIHQTSDR